MTMEAQIKALVDKFNAKTEADENLRKEVEHLKKTVNIDLPRQSFEGWDVKTNTMRVVPGKYELMVGNSSADKDLKKILVNIK